MQRQEKIELLKSLIRIDSDDGNELAVAELLATVLINIGRNPVTLVMGWIGSLNVHLDVFSFGVHCIFDC